MSRRSALEGGSLYVKTVRIYLDRGVQILWGYKYHVTPHIYAFLHSVLEWYSRGRKSRWRRRKFRWWQRSTGRWGNKWWWYRKCKLPLFSCCWSLILWAHFITCRVQLDIIIHFTLHAKNIKSATKFAKDWRGQIHVHFNLKMFVLFQLFSDSVDLLDSPSLSDFFTLGFWTEGLLLPFTTPSWQLIS